MQAFTKFVLSRLIRSVIVAGTFFLPHGVSAYTTELNPLIEPSQELSGIDPLLASDPYEKQTVEDIRIVVESSGKERVIDKNRILASLHTKKGDPFSQTVFDRDLKRLAKDYDPVEPRVERREGGVSISLTLHVRPTVRAILFRGNTKVRTGTLRRELGMLPNTLFDRNRFVSALEKIREYYVKRGYFESEIEYKTVAVPNTDEIDVVISIREGRSGRIGALRITGLTSAEESAVLHLIQTKKYGLFSGITGTGRYHEEALEHDKHVIVNYLHNLGYADAYVTIRTAEGKKGRLEILIDAFKGEPFRFGRITMDGNSLFDREKLLSVFAVKEGSSFSPENLTQGIGRIKDLYGKKGYIETSVHYVLRPASKENVYDVELHIEEGKRFKIGMIRIVGNASTHKNVILRESHLIPGEIFDVRRLRATQERLKAIGYFTSVSVYPIQTEGHENETDHYRDIVIDVEETPTGHIMMSGGFSSTDNIFLGLELSEDNFNYRGLTRFWKAGGMRALRGAGEYARVGAKIGKRQQSYTLTWVDPYLRDSLWRFGFDLGYSVNRLQAKDDYKINKSGGSVFASYPLTSSWTFGLKWRVNNSITHIYEGGLRTHEERDNNGLVSGLSTSMTFDSTDHPFKPRRGVRFYTELEIAGVRRHARDPRIFPFAKLDCLNTYYHPLWHKGWRKAILKLRTEFRFLYPFADGRPDLVSLGERFFLGGENSVRGYRPFSIGEKFAKEGANGKKSKDSDAPMGGVSSSLVSVECLQNLFTMLDAFLFFDAGAISQHRLRIPKPEISVGFGLRIDVANRLPFMVGIGFPIKPTDRDDVQRVFFSMGATF